MLVFPQLTTGASAIYPVTRQAVARTVVNVLGDGSTVVFADGDAGVRRWELRATGLSLAEWTAIDTLFQAVSGRFTTFTFLDPAGNLLAHSEEFGEPQWSNGALIQLTAGVADPLGSVRATRVVNAGSAAGGVTQALAVPGNFRYALSAWAKTIAASNLTLSANTVGASASQTFALAGQWRRVSMEVDLGSSTASVVFGVALEPGASVDLFGMQVEPQRGASDYKKTGATGGLYGEARFGEDELTATAKGTDAFDAVVKIVAS